MMVIIIRINSPINGEDHLDNGKPERKVILSNVEASRVEFVNSSVVAVKLCQLPGKGRMIVKGVVNRQRFKQLGLLACYL